MTTVSELEKQLLGKIRILDFCTEDAKAAIERSEVRLLTRHKRVFENKLEEIFELKVSILELKLGNENEDTRAWTNELDDKLAGHEDLCKQLSSLIIGMNKELLIEAKPQQERTFDDIPSKSSREAVRTMRAKLPKLVITKFQGTHIDWFRFWSQFEAEIDTADIEQVTKFSYLKELVIPKVRMLIDGLPFTTEGYERAKHILKSKYGKSSEVINSYICSIMSLPVIKGTSPSKLHEFYINLLSSVQALESMGKLKEINGYTRATLDKLEGIRADLVRSDNDWQEWGFSQLVDALGKWTERNPVSMDSRGYDGGSFEVRERGHQHRGKSFQANQQSKKRVCPYCESEDHKAIECSKVNGVSERRDILRKKRLCFNCAGPSHRAAECRSKSKCQNCDSKHHTSICDKQGDTLMVATAGWGVTYPIVVVIVEGIKCRAMLDTGSGSTYISSTLAERIGKKPQRREFKQIDMMMCSRAKRIEVFQLEVKNLKNDFRLSIEASKVERDVLLAVPNPQYEEMLRQHTYLMGVVMDDRDNKAELPIHMILGASEYSKIKTKSSPRIGDPGEPVAELTKFGWTIMSPGTEIDLGNIFAAQTLLGDYHQLCSLDVLGLEDHPMGSQTPVYNEFKEQLKRDPEGWYETGLLWKCDAPDLPSNKSGSIIRLNHLLNKFKKDPDLLDKYDAIIQDQLEQGIVEMATEDPVGREFYLPHKPVVRETAESTKLRIVFDASARANNSAPSLNDCLETGPPLQNFIWNILVRNRMQPVTLCADLKQAFLQIRINSKDRDALRFHWINNKDPNEVQVLRFTRALFGLNQSPFLLGGTLEQHLLSYKDEHPFEVEEIKRSLYVDDVIMGGCTDDMVHNLKEVSEEIFGEAHFVLHKWHSNLAALEGNDSTSGEQQSYAKHQLGVKQNETKLLGILWNKASDKFGIDVSGLRGGKTKREVLRGLASVYDPLGIVSPVTLLGKIVFRSVCDENLSWDAELPVHLSVKWRKFTNSLPDKIEVPRSLVKSKQEISAIDIHAFGDASKVGTAAAVYAVIEQEEGFSQGLLTAKSRLSKKGLTIPRLEIISGHMAANIIDNVCTSLKGLPIRDTYCWLDSTTALHWIKGNGVYKEFVSNRVAKIREKANIKWRWVSTTDNPADKGSRGCAHTHLEELWFKGPAWLSDKTSWPDDIVTQANDTTESEAKPIKEIFRSSIVVQEDDRLEALLSKHEYWKAIRIMAWVGRFVHNCRTKKSSRILSPLTTEEIEKQILLWVKRVQDQCLGGELFQQDQIKLNIQPGHDGILRCHGRIQGDFPIYLPPSSSFAGKLIMNAHKCTLHGGVGLTMAKVRERYWIPRLRQLVKKIRGECYGCKRFQAIAFSNPPTATLPKERTEGTRPFQVVGVDYAGPLVYKSKASAERKAYILLFACSLTRALHLELLPYLTTEEFVLALKRFIARRTRPEKIFSDNAKTFVAAAKWLKKVKHAEEVNNFLARESIRWQFNLSRAPWWGGQYERIVGLVKNALFKVIGRGEVLLDVESTLNNRPLSYAEDDIQLPMLTPNTLIHGQSNYIPENDVESIESKDLRKRARFIQKCKDVVWKRWTSEYLKGLRDRHNLGKRHQEVTLGLSDVVLIKGENTNRGMWQMGIVQRLIQGRDGITRGARVKTKNGEIERAVQHLYPLELSCDAQPGDSQQQQLNPDAEAYKPRRAAVIARDNIAHVTNFENEEL